MKPVVILDTNALYGAKPFTRSESAVLLALAKIGRIRLVVPDVVVRELARQWADSIDDHAARIGSAAKSIDGITSEVSGPSSSVQLPVIDRSSLHKSAISTLNQRGAETPACPAVAVADLLERDLDRRKPFGKDGKGFRDALIWENVKVTCAGLARATPVLFVTNNSNDFCDDSGDLHPDLRGELPVGQRFEIVKRLHLLLGHGEIDPLVALLRVQESIEPTQLTMLVDDALADLNGADVASTVGVYDSDGIYTPAFGSLLDEVSFEEIMFDEDTIEFDIFRTGNDDEMTIRVTSTPTAVSRGSSARVTSSSTIPTTSRSSRTGTTTCSGPASSAGSGLR